MKIPRKVNQRSGGIFDRLTDASNEIIDYLASTRLKGDGKTIAIDESLDGMTLRGLNGGNGNFLADNENDPDWRDNVFPQLFIGDRAPVIQTAVTQKDGTVVNDDYERLQERWNLGPTGQYQYHMRANFINLTFQHLGLSILNPSLQYTKSRLHFKNWENENDASDVITSIKADLIQGISNKYGGTFLSAGGTGQIYTGEIDSRLANRRYEESIGPHHHIWSGPVRDGGFTLDEILSSAIANVSVLPANQPDPAIVGVLYLHAEPEQGTQYDEEAMIPNLSHTGGYYKTKWTISYNMAVFCAELAYQSYLGGTGWASPNNYVRLGSGGVYGDIPLAYIMLSDWKQWVYEYIEKGYSTKLLDIYWNVATPNPIMILPPKYYYK